MGAYVAQVDRALGSGQALYPASMGPVGVATDMPGAPPPPPGRSGTSGGVDQAGGRYQSQWQAAQGIDGQASSAASSGQAEAQAGRAGATGVRGSAQAQAAAIAPATRSPAGVKLLVSAMDDKLAAMQRQLTTTQEQNRRLALRMRQLLGADSGMGSVSGAGGMSALGGGGAMASPAAGMGMSGLGAGPIAGLSSTMNSSLPQSVSQATDAISGTNENVSAGPGTGTPLGRLTASSGPRDVAEAIINEAHRRGYSPQQTVAILSTAMQESGLRPHAVSPNGAWVGIFQQDTSYPGRGNPNAAIAEFFNRLDMKGGRHAPDIWKTIFWLQQAPGAASAAAAFDGDGARQHYLAEVRSQVTRAANLYRSITGG